MINGLKTDGVDYRLKLLCVDLSATKKVDKTKVKVSIFKRIARYFSLGDRPSDVVIREMEARKHEMADEAERNRKKFKFL